MLLLAFFHIVISFQFLFGSYRFYILQPEYYAPFGVYGKFVYLTFWNSIFQGVFFAICALNDVLGTNEVGLKPEGTPRIRKFKDFIFACFGFPFSMFVTATYWILYVIDRELVFPLEVDAFFPPWLNQLLHTNIAIFTLFELIWSFRMYPKRKTGIRWITSVLIIYTVWVLYIYVVMGHWPYGVLIQMNWTQRSLFLVGGTIFMYGLYFLGETLNELIWAKELEKVRSGKKDEEATTKKKAMKQT